jgi:hypothetical protein
VQYYSSSESIIAAGLGDMTPKPGRLAPERTVIDHYHFRPQNHSYWTKNAEIHESGPDKSLHPAKICSLPSPHFAALWPYRSSLSAYVRLSQERIDKFVRRKGQQIFHLLTDTGE